MQWFFFFPRHTGRLYHMSLPVTNDSQRLHVSSGPYLGWKNLFVIRKSCNFLFFSLISVIWSNMSESNNFRLALVYCLQDWFKDEQNNKKIKQEIKYSVWKQKQSENLCTGPEVTFAQIFAGIKGPPALILHLRTYCQMWKRNSLLSLL